MSWSGHDSQVSNPDKQSASSSGSTGTKKQHEKQDETYSETRSIEIGKSRGVHQDLRIDLDAVEANENEADQNLLYEFAEIGSSR